jgi:hypothetical protein
MQARQALHRLLQKVCSEMHKLRRTAAVVAEQEAPQRVPKLNVLFTSQPFVTHVRPHERWAKRCIARGHDVRLAAPAPLAAIIRGAYRIPHLPAGVDWTTDRRVQEALTRTLIQAGNDAFSRMLFRDYMAGMSVLPMAKAILETARVWMPDVIIHDCSEFGGYVAGQVLGVPTISSDNGLARIIYELHADCIRPMLTEHRRALGLGAEPETPGSYAHMLATPAPRDFLLGGLSIPALRCYRHENPSRFGERLPGWIDELPAGTPFIYVMLGSTGYCAPRLTPLFEHANRIVLDALARFPCAALVSVGKGNVGKYESQPSHIQVVEYAAQPLALQRAKLFIGHGGFGGLRESIHAGTPMLLLPQFADQRPNAEQVAARGLGLMLDPTTATEGDVRNACEELLADAAYGAAVEALRLEMAHLPPLATLVDELGFHYQWNQNVR